VTHRANNAAIATVPNHGHATGDNESQTGQPESICALLRL
jgi:hypothetical protein